MIHFGQIKVYFFLALRYLLGRSNKKEGRYLLSAAGGIAISLIPIMVTLVVTDGMIRGITDRFLELGTGHLQIHSFQDFADAEESLESPRISIEEAAPLIQEHAMVRGLWMERQGIGIIVGKKGKTGTTIRALGSSFWEDAEAQKYLTVVAGEGAITGDNDVLIGSELAKKLGAEVGGSLRIMTIRSSESGATIPRISRFTVRGIVSSGYHEIDAMWCLISYEAGARILDNRIPPFLIVKINDPYAAADTAAALFNWEYQDSFRALTWKQLQSAQYSSYEQTRQILLFIMALIVLIAAVNVSSAISMLVIERRRDIAVLKSFGLSRRGTTATFLMGSLVTGFSGVIAGISAGLLLGAHINQIVHGMESLLNFFTRLVRPEASFKILDPGFYLETIPIVIDWQTVIIIGIFTLVCTAVSSWIPARHAGKSRPAELLQKH